MPSTLATCLKEHADRNWEDGPVHLMLSPFRDRLERIPNELNHAAGMAHAHRVHQLVAGQTIQLRVEPLGANPGSLSEAGIDHVTIVRQ